MNRRLTRFAIGAALALFAAGGLASTALATYHENRIREVHEGNGATGDYVELQSFAAGQNQVGGRHIVSYDAGGGAPLTDYLIPSNVANGADQATILIADSPMVGGVTADFNAGADLNVDNTGGTVCFTDTSIDVKLDCVAFDGVGGADVTVPTGAGFGSPFMLPGANLNEMSLIRTTSAGCATALDPADDTDSAADFTLGAGSPRNNAATPTETVCPPSPTSPNSPGSAAKKKCKKKKKHKRSADAAKKKCKKKKKKKH
jgi:hypothetical protein